MAEEPVRGFPLFPLGIVALPSESVPLHIFEDRYRKLIEHCLQSDGEEFGILWLSDEELKRVGCACEIEQVLERMEDGRMNIVVRGTRPFELLERQDDLPYPAGAVEFLGEQPEQPEEEVAVLTRELYRQRMAATVEFEVEAKQQLLELRSENARLALLGTLLAAAMERLELVERAQVRALSNGKVRFG
jgi:Lon protease-like protein